MKKQVTSGSLENEYPNLTDIQKEILQILALITYSFNYHMVLRCFETICDIPEVKLSYIKVKKQFAELIKEGLILQDTFGGIELDLGDSNWLIRNHVIRNDNLDNYREIIAYKLPYNDYFHSNYNINFRDFRVAFYLRETGKVMEILESDITKETQNQLFLNSILFNFDPEFFLDTPYESFATSIAMQLCHYKVATNLPIGDCFPFLLKNIDNIKVPECHSTIATVYLFQGELNKLEKFIDKYKAYLPYFPAILTFARGDLDSAQKQFEEAIAFQRKIRHDRNFCPEGIEGFFYCFIYLAFASTTESVDAGFKRAINYGIKYNFNSSFYKFVKGIIIFWEEKNGSFEKLIKSLFLSDNIIQTRYFLLFVTPLLQQYKERMQINYDEDYLYSNIDKYLDNKYPFLAFQSYKLFVRYFDAPETNSSNYYINNYADQFEKYNDKFIDFASLFVDQPEWKDKLNQLNKIAPARISKSASGSGKEKETRILWYVSVGDEDDYCYDDNSRLQFVPQYQTCTKNGKWSKGRALSLKAFSEGDYAKTELDKKIASCIKRQKYWRRTIYAFNYGKVLKYFYKHPLLFLKDNPKVSFELINEPLQLFVKKNNNNISLSLSHSHEIIAERSCADYLLLEEFPGKAKILETHGINLKIIELFENKDKLEFPIESEKELNETILKLSSEIIVHSDGKNDLEIDSVKADSKIHVHILPVGNGIRAEYFIRPFISEGPYFKPGFGSDTVISGIAGSAKQAKRDLNKEKSNAERILQKCPEFALRKNNELSFLFESPGEALEALSNLLEVKKEVIIEWPEGEKIRVIRNYNEDDTNFSVKKVDDWFQIESTIQIDENRILDMKQLLDVAPKSRFIELNDGEFIALTESLRRKLENISDFAYFDNDIVKIHPLNAHQADDVLCDVDSFIPDEDWKLQIDKLKNAEALQPKLPSTLQAELRPYQLEGFEWLAKLSTWGVGACLADDMGLGKTVQALAVILEKAKEGPTLVVAPSSVCMNWEKEANKFAPTLNPIIFGSGDRKETLKKLKPYDLVISSYGLLLHEAELLTGINWTVTVLDEAQFIKNFKAKRTKAAFNLKSDFKLITTGTPIENNLSELWTIFSFINPGLLGKQREFFIKFGLPIEKYNDKTAAKSLKKSIRPFILRRTKAQVLDDLPPKTEINLLVDLSEDESAFYETLRRDAVEMIESMDEEKSGTVHLQILAELMKLRRACCHPSLVSDEIKIESSKLKLFNEIIEELIANKHKALVFSQFVGHLTILKKSLINGKLNINISMVLLRQKNDRSLLTLFSPEKEISSS